MRPDLVVPADRPCQICEVFRPAAGRRLRFFPPPRPPFARLASSDLVGREEGHLDPRPPPGAGHRSQRRRAPWRPPGRCTGRARIPHRPLCAQRSGVRTVHRAVDLVWSMTGPSLATSSRRPALSIIVRMTTVPPGRLWCSALSIRLATSRSTSLRSPSVGAALRSRTNCTPQTSASVLPPPRPLTSRVPRSTGCRRHGRGLSPRKHEQRVDELLLLLPRDEDPLVRGAERPGWRRGSDRPPGRVCAGGRAECATRGTRWPRTGAASERSLEPPEQSVDGVAEFLELVVRPVRRRDAGAGSRPRCPACVAVIVRSGRNTRPAMIHPSRQRPPP